LVDEYTRILSQLLKMELAFYWLLKSEMSSLLAFEKLSLLKSLERFSCRFLKLK